jgi:hypothetical protein
MNCNNWSELQLRYVLGRLEKSTYGTHDELCQRLRDYTPPTPTDLVLEGIKKLDFDMVKDALADGGDPNVMRDNESPLTMILYLEDIDSGDERQMMETLLEAGADPNQPIKSYEGSDQSRTPLYIAVLLNSQYNNNIGAIEALIAYGADQETTIQQLYKDQLKLPVIPLESGLTHAIDFVDRARDYYDQRDNKDIGDLYNATVSGNVLEIQRLIALGIDPYEIPPGRRVNPIEAARNNNRIDLVRILTQK